MGYRKFTADQIFDGHQFHTGKALVTDEEGVVLELLPVEEAGDQVERIDGILTPGLINCHCHLELSHLKGIIPPHTGLIDFLCAVVTKRDFSRQIIQQAIEQSELEMYRNGIVAVGDIGNTADTALVKSASHIRWNNFVEVLSFTDAGADQQVAHYQQIASQMSQSSLTAPVPNTTALVPHAPYTISPRTFRLINDATEGQVISMHNQEHPAEDELYRTGGGAYLRLFGIFGITESPFPVTGLSSLRSVLPYFDKGQTLILVHNTYMPEEDIQWANEQAKRQGLDLVYCLCPQANLYIEDRMPPVDTLLRNNCRLVLGTDSYSSNWQLSIAKEMQVLNQHKGIPIDTLLKMATLEGARALGWEKDLGSFEKGKRPGLVSVSPDLGYSARLL